MASPSLAVTPVTSPSPLPFGNSYPRRRHGRLYIYYSTMGYLFQIVRDIDPRLRLLVDTFTLLGFLATGRFALRFLASALTGLRTHLWSRVVSLDLKTKYGQWAVVTGATDGVGLEYARQLAGRGLSLVLVGRSESKLATVKAELASKYGPHIEIVTVLADLNSDDPQLYGRLQAEICAPGRDIGVLVNNAGVMYDSPKRFLDQPESKMWSHVRVNMLAVVMMTRLVLPSMVRKKKGLLINVSSIAAYQPLPLMGLYSASKVFVEWFSETLSMEYRQYGIDVQTLVPNYIATKMTGFSDLLQKPSLAFPDAATFTANALATAGRAEHTCGYWFHDLQHYFTRMFVPDWAYRSVSWYFLRHIDSTGSSSSNTSNGDADEAIRGTLEKKKIK